MSKTLTPRLVTRWQQEPLAWLVFGLPALVVVASFVTLAIAIESADGLVVDDYYKQGLEINKVLVREDYAKAAGLIFTPDLTSDGTLSLRFAARAGFAYPDKIDVQLDHATRSDVDRKVAMTHASDAVYVGTMTRLEAGPWYIDASTTQWRVVKRVMVDGAGVMKQ